MSLDAVNLIILVSAGLVVASVFTSLLAFRVGAPMLLLFLGIGLLAGHDGPGGILFGDPSAAFLLGSASLGVILFDSGFHTPLKSYRLAAYPAITMATLGTVVSALVVALPAHFLLSLDWRTSLLLGTILAPTDAAALFFLLRTGGITIRDRVRSTLEVESATNDPVAASLVLVLTAIPAGGLDSGGPQMLLLLLQQTGGGVAMGLLGGAGIVLAVNRLKLEPGLYPVVVIGLALTLFALTNALGGSGFLAAYLAGLVAGNARLQWGGALRRFQAGITWLAQIIMFLAMGLLAKPSEFPAMATSSALMAAVLIVLARPAAVALCLSPFRFGWRERFFIAWVGLRGAVSILLSLVPVVAGLPGAGNLFVVAFLVVLVSLVVQGWSVRPLARWLDLIVPDGAGPVERMEVDLPGLADRELVTYHLHADSAVARGRPLPRWARPLLVRRAGQLLSAPRRLAAGDQVYLLVAPPQVPVLDRLFGRSRDGDLSEPTLQGDFAIAADVTVKALSDTYGLALTGSDGTLSLADLFHREFHNDLEVGDRLRLGPVELIVRDIDDGVIGSLGLSLDPPAKPLAGWERWKMTIDKIFG